jgi:23S rRNA pseudouridine2605 synthase
MGIASRRKSEEMIREGRVIVNGQTSTIGMKADPSKDHIKIDGKLIVKKEQKVYMAFNKPKQVITTLNDPEGRPTVKDFLKGVKYRVYPVGRLDYDSEGLLLMTNDGEFTNALLHPSKKIPKTYLVKIKGEINEKALEHLQRGIRLDDGFTAPSQVKKLKKTENNSWLEITIHEGKKRQIRRMLEQIRHPVLKLKRIKIDSIELGTLKAGEYRYLMPKEIQKIKKDIARKI